MDNFPWKQRQSCTCKKSTQYHCQHFLERFIPSDATKNVFNSRIVVPVSEDKHSKLVSNTTSTNKQNKVDMESLVLQSWRLALLPLVKPSNDCFPPTLSKHQYLFVRLFSNLLHLQKGYEWPTTRTESYQLQDSEICSKVIATRVSILC